MFSFLLFQILFSCSTGIEVILRHYNNCRTDIQPVTADVTFTDTFPQTFNVTLISSINMGENLMVQFDWKMKMAPGAPLVKIWDMTSQDGPCKILVNYIGPLFADVQRQMGMVPGACPIPKGRYYLRNYQPNFALSKLNNVPKGKVYIHSQWIEKNTKKVVYCSNTEVDYN